MSAKPFRMHAPTMLLATALICITDVAYVGMLHCWKVLHRIDDLAKMLHATPMSCTLVR